MDLADGVGDLGSAVGVYMMITDTVTFLGYVMGFVSAGVGKGLTPSGWKGPLILALVLGDIALSYFFAFARLKKAREGR